MRFTQRRLLLGAIGCLPVAVATTATVGSPVPIHTTAKSGKRKLRIGIALGGGSLHGVAHVGALRAFAERGLEFDCIAGSSAGAIIGVLAAARLPPARIDTIVRGVEWPGLASFAWSGKGLMRHDKLRSLIDEALGNRRIEHLPVAFAAIATDLSNGSRVVIRSGSPGTAVSASSSVPIIFEPVTIDGRELVDGGLTEPVPVIAVREMGADIVIGVDVAYRPGEESFSGFTGIALQAMHIMGNALITEQIRRADIPIRMNVHQWIGREDSHDQLVEAGYAGAMKVWPRLAAMLALWSSK